MKFWMGSICWRTQIFFDIFLMLKYGDKTKRLEKCIGFFHPSIHQTIGDTNFRVSKASGLFLNTLVITHSGSFKLPATILNWLWGINCYSSLMLRLESQCNTYAIRVIFRILTQHRSSHSRMFWEPHLHKIEFQPQPQLKLDIKYWIWSSIPFFIFVRSRTYTRIRKF